MLSGRSSGAENMSEVLFQIRLRFGVPTCFADTGLYSCDHLAVAPPSWTIIAGSEGQLSETDSRTGNNKRINNKTDRFANGEVADIRFVADIISLL
jgi:hypothetical protein